jgi:prolyl oligopeptidase
VNIASCLLLLTLASPTLAKESPPIAPVRNVTDEYFGTRINDPYRWMEDLKAPETQGWIRSQGEHAREYLDHLPMHGELLARMKELNSSITVVETVDRTAGHLYYYKTRPEDNDHSLYMREGLDGAERLLVDPAEISSAGKRYSINDFSPSPDGRYVSFIVSIGGSENGEIRVIETATRKDMGERIDRARFDAGTWLPDGKSFLYSRLPKLPPGAAPNEAYEKRHVYRHVLGTSPDADEAVFGYGVNPEIELDPAMTPYAAIHPGSPYVFVHVIQGTARNRDVYVAPIDTLTEKPIPWRKVVSSEDEVSLAAEHGGALYLLTYKNTPRYKVIRLDLKNPDISKAKVIFPAGEGVVEGLVAARDALYVKTLDGGPQRLWRVDYQGGAPREIKLPAVGSVFELNGDAQTDGVLFSSDSYTRSPVTYVYDPASGTLRDTHLNPPHPASFSGIESLQVKVKSHDGTMVPMVILHKKGLKLDASNPALLQGYGSYGFNNLDPVFQTVNLPWLERGGVLAFAGVRGGGEYGKEWHEAGLQKTKANTWKDFIACAEYLSAAKYTAPRHLGIQSASAGGILISNAIAERPDLFGAAVIKAGMNNTLRYETTPIGPLNVPEFGSVKTREGFMNLLAMDGYHKIKAGVKYPAALLTHGMNDPRVDPWMSAKMAARLQAATASGKPVLLRVDYDHGHGIGSSKQQQNEQQADIYAFLFEQLRGAETAEAP